MARKTGVQICFSTSDGYDWLINAKVWFGSQGDRWTPPDGDEVEYFNVIEDLGKAMGPQPNWSFEDFAERFQLDDKTLLKIGDKCCQAAYDEEYYSYGEED